MWKSDRTGLEEHTREERWKFRDFWLDGGTPSPCHFLRKIFHREALGVDLSVPKERLKRDARLCRAVLSLFSEPCSYVFSLNGVSSGC